MVLMNCVMWAICYNPHNEVNEDREVGGGGGVILESPFFNEGSNLAFLQFYILTLYFVFVFVQIFTVQQ